MGYDALAGEPHGRRNYVKVGGQKRFSTHFFPCNTIELMLNFAKVGGSAAPSKPRFLRPWSPQPKNSYNATGATSSKIGRHKLLKLVDLKLMIAMPYLNDQWLLIYSLLHILVVGELHLVWRTVAHKRSPRGERQPSHVPKRPSYFLYFPDL